VLTDLLTFARETVTVARWALCGVRGQFLATLAELAGRPDDACRITHAYDAECERLLDTLGR
jgi:hypothetical protein